MKFTVGVVIPIYNVEKYLAECLESVVNQTYKDYFVILVDDGSLDKSYNIAKTYASKYDNIVLITKDNEGLSSARNVGIDFFKNELKSLNIKNCSFDKTSEFYVTQNTYRINMVYRKDGVCSNILTSPEIDYLMFLDPDDKWELNCIEACVQNIRDADVVWFDYKFIDELNDKKRFRQFWYYNFTSTMYLSIKDFFRMHLEIEQQHCFWFSVMGMFKFKLLLDNNLNFIYKIQHEDFHFGTVLFLRSKKICILYKPLYYVRIRNHSITNNDFLPYFIRNDLMPFFDCPKNAKDYYVFSSLLITLAVLSNEKKNIKDAELADIYNKYLLKFSRFIFKKNDFRYLYLSNLIYENSCAEDPYLILKKYNKRAINNDFLNYINDYTSILESRINRDKHNLDFFLKYGSLSERIKSHLSYKIGFSITSSKTIFAKIMLPFVLISVVLYHKNTESIKRNFPKIEEYPDYKYSVDLKNSVEYNIGREFLRLTRSWYNGKLFIFFLKVCFFKK
ncbi:glycosyltransferase family 2 protein [Campylobacter lari]|nr:glycosyltransferase family 2 protein [Campylobacter lari]EAK9869208.1 glycosyltransferase family 2 protein [Campylobacter lari]EAK9882097.1 glycosyltransferase family 2 protein [Campylobacter lari]EGK8092960.1 glycosyltransferase family 2 protein [Campylobacter lari]EJV0519501.1 glycosyltransferase family 2 protein [Campylobacter lari]